MPDVPCARRFAVCARIRRFAWLLCILALGGLLPAASARLGYIETHEGKIIEGDISLSNGLFIITTTNAPGASRIVQVALETLDQVRFDARPAPTVTAPPGKGHGLLGYYFNGTNATGPVIVRLDQTIDFDWGAAEPVRGIGRDGFSVVWTGEVEAPASGPFVFHVGADEGGRLLVNNQLLCESVAGGPRSETNGVIVLKAGRRYPLRFEYFDLSGPARVRLLWSGPGVPKSVVPKDRLYAASFLDGHQASITSERGLLATYYRNPDFSGPTFTRIDPTIDFNGTEGVPAPNFSPNSFSVRWRGQLVGHRTETCAFYLLADEPARVWLNQQPLLDHPMESLIERLAARPLKEGERYEILVEARNTRGGLAVKLFWSSPSMPKTVIPATNLFPAKAPAPQGAGSDGGIAFPPGLLLRNGSFLAGTVDSASESTVRATGLLLDTPISTVNVARLYLQAIPQSLLQRQTASRTGALLASGDFVDGDLRSLSEGRVQINSILFGLRSFDLSKEVLAVFLHDLSPAVEPYEVQLLDQSVLQVAAVGIESSGLIVEERMLGRLKLPMKALAHIRRQQ